MGRRYGRRDWALPRELRRTLRLSDATAYAHSELTFSCLQPIERHHQAFSINRSSFFYIVRCRCHNVAKHFTADNLRVKKSKDKLQLCFEFKLIMVYSEDFVLNRSKKLDGRPVSIASQWMVGRVWRNLYRKPLIGINKVSNDKESDSWITKLL